MLKFIPLCTIATKIKYEVFINGKSVLTTFDKSAADMEVEMSFGKVDVKTTRVAK